MPERIQLRRTKGWRKPEGAVTVARPSRWGNWYAVRPTRVVDPESGLVSRSGGRLVVVHLDRRGHETGAQWGTWDSELEASRFAVDLYRASLDASYHDVDGPLRRSEYLAGLTGRDLACWCPLEDEHGNRFPCHADVLLELANTPEMTAAPLR